MTKTESRGWIFGTHEAADAAIRHLAEAGFDMKKLSLIGRGWRHEEQPMGFYTAGDRIKAWGGTGAFWGGIWGLLLAPAVFVLPGLGMLGLAGPVAAALVGALEGAALGAGASALGAALVQMGLPEHAAMRYESALKVDKYVLLVHGNAQDLHQVHQLLAAEHLAAAAA